MSTRKVKVDAFVMRAKAWRGEIEKGAFYALTPGRQRGYVLHFTEAMDGRLSDGQNVYTFEALKGRGAERRGSHWAVPRVR